MLSIIDDRNWIFLALLPAQKEFRLYLAISSVQEERC